MQEHPRSGGKFTFDGVPFICNRYLNVHIDAVKVLLALLPHSKKMHMVAIRGPLRDMFLQAVAMLLCIHGLYEETITRLQITITPNRQVQQYSTTTFANKRDLKVEHVAHFLASVGITVDKAKTWRQWAAAYMDIGLMKHPEDPPLLEVKKASHAHINKDPSQALTKVNPGTPGYYHPALEKACAQCTEQ